MAKKNAQQFRVGLTGGIASGKTVVAGLFAKLGAQVIDTDEIARQVVASGQPALAKIGAAFGPGVLTPDGDLDRAALRNLVFDDVAGRRQLEAILHPIIRRETVVRAATADGPYQLLVVPLLIETDFRDLVDRVLVVDCPETVQRERLLARDEEDPARAGRIMDAQLSRSERLAAADDIVDNAGSHDRTRRQVEALHERYLQLATAA
jgi:dephospho-CoA kinase